MSPAVILGRVLALAAGVAAVVMAAASGAPDTPTAAQIAATVAVTAPSVVLGLLIMERRPGNMVGALLVAVGAVPLMVLAVESWGLTTWPGATVSAGFAEAAWVWLYPPVVWLTLLFPTGRQVSSRWRWAVAASVAVPVATQIAAALDAPEVVSLLLGLALLGVLVAATASVIVRYRRGSALVRRQIRWFAWSAMLLPAALLISWLSFALFDDIVPLGTGALGLMFVAIPVAVAVAVLRHDLYDIDRLISRTVTYTLLSALLAGLFVGAASLFGVLLGRGSAPAAALAAAICTASFSPLRRRVQAAVDRRFYHDRRTAVATVRRFVEEVRDGRAAPEQIEVTLRLALHDDLVRLVYRLPDREQPWVDGLGRVVPEPAGAVPIVVSGQELALVTIGPRSRTRAGLVREVLREAHLPIELTRLQAHLRVALTETAASRARIVQAGDDERRRLQRDLHDGAQQRLVALGLDLRHAQHALPAGDPSRETLERAVRDLREAVTELRRIAHGLHPSALDEGLPAALRALVRTAPVRVELDLDNVVLPRAVTAAAYFVAAEAVANALKHAGAEAVTISLRQADGYVRLAVADDGRGGATAAGGTGLTGMADRVATLAGTLRLDSPVGAGTRIEVVLPCGS